jgi:hypothetical protein
MSMSETILWCFAQATYVAMKHGTWIGGSSEWRDAQAVLFVAKNHLYGDGKAYFR